MSWESKQVFFGIDVKHRAKPSSGRYGTTFVAVNACHQPGSSVQISSCQYVEMGY